jgi:hypothetical protein
VYLPNKIIIIIIILRKRGKKSLVFTLGNNLAIALYPTQKSKNFMIIRVSTQVCKDPLFSMF